MPEKIPYIETITRYVPAHVDIGQPVYSVDERLVYLHFEPPHVWVNENKHIEYRLATEREILSHKLTHMTYVQLLNAWATDIVMEGAPTPERLMEMDIIDALQHLNYSALTDEEFFFAIDTTV